MVDVTRFEMILEQEQRIARLEKELAEAVRGHRMEPVTDAMSKARNCAVIERLGNMREFIKLQRGHYEALWHCAKAEGITERQYSEWKHTRLMSAGR